MLVLIPVEKRDPDPKGEGGAPRDGDDARCRLFVVGVGVLSELLLSEERDSGLGPKRLDATLRVSSIAESRDARFCSIFVDTLPSPEV